MDCPHNIYETDLTHPQEAKERSAVLHLHDDDVDALDALIHFLYNFTYKDSMIKVRSLVGRNITSTSCQATP